MHKYMITVDHTKGSLMVMIVIMCAIIFGLFLFFLGPPSCLHSSPCSGSVLPPPTVPCCIRGQLL